MAQEPAPADLAPALAILKARRIDLNADLNMHFRLPTGGGLRIEPAERSIRLLFSSIEAPVDRMAALRQKIFESWVPERVRPLLPEATPLALEFWGLAWQTPEPIGLNRQNLRVFFDGAEGWIAQWDTWESSQQRHEVKGTLAAVLAALPEPHADEARQALARWL